MQTGRGRFDSRLAIGRGRNQDQCRSPVPEVARAIEVMRGSGAYPATVLAFESLVLTACRSGGVRGARWDELDLERWEWCMPPERMQRGREHRVPLSARAPAVLRAPRGLADGSGPVFPFAAGLGHSPSWRSRRGDLPAHGPV